MGQTEPWVRTLDLVSNVLLPGFVLIALAFRDRVNRAHMARWAVDAKIQLTAETEPALRRYLRLSWRARFGGALLGFVIAVAQPWVLVHVGGGWELPMMLIGYMLGALFADLVIHRPNPATAVALLVPRRFDNYLPSAVTAVKRGLALAVSMVAIVFFFFQHFLAAPLLPQQLSKGNVLWLSSGLGLVPLATAGLLIVGLVAALGRTILGRPQRLFMAEEIDTDDAMRSYSMHLMAGAGGGLLLAILSMEVRVFAAALTTPAPTYLTGTLELASVALWLSSLLLWTVLDDPHGFRVHRTMALA
jgi:hypothetical protein